MKKQLNSATWWSVIPYIIWYSRCKTATLRHYLKLSQSPDEEQFNTSSMLSQPSKFHGHMEKAALALHSRKRHNGRSWGKPSCLSRMSWQAMGIWARRKKTCSPLSLLASAKVLIFIISNAKHSPLNKNHQVVVSAFPSTWNKKVNKKTVRVIHNDLFTTTMFNHF